MEMLIVDSAETIIQKRKSEPYTLLTKTSDM